MKISKMGVVIAVVAQVVGMSCMAAFLEKDSTDFEYKYEMVVDPAAEDLDGNGSGDFTAHTDWVINGNGFATYSTTATGGSFYDGGAANGILHNLTENGPWTAEVRVDVKSMATNADSAFMLYGCRGSLCDLRIGTKRLIWNGADIGEYRNDSKDGYHIFRVAGGNGAEVTFCVYVDGEIFASNLYARRSDTVSGFIGDGSGSVGGDVSIDYFRLDTTGAFAPLVSKEKDMISAVSETNESSMSSLGKISDTKWQKLKKQVLNRKRKVIHNNDGCDAIYFPHELAATKDNFISRRLANAQKTKINTYSYCPGCAGFGNLTSRTVVGDQFTIDPPDKKYRNITKELLAMGTDPLKITEEFCHNRGLECFVSVRCNDTHDQVHQKNNPYYLFPPYKTKHPELLMGRYNKRPPYGYWSAVDYTHKEIREYFVAQIKELISNYNLDGVELDFCRHLHYFKSVMWGAEASREELGMMTDCIRGIRDFAEKIGRERQHPILISVRVPDSLGMCSAVGLDLENWMREGLIDIVIGGFYMQLNPWKTTVDACHKYGVKFYPSLDESRIRRIADGFGRTTHATDRARIAAALTAGADGIYFFNRYGRKQHNNMYGNMDDIRLRDKTYFITYRYQTPMIYLSTGETYKNIKDLSPLTPAYLYPDDINDYYFEFGDDMSRQDVLNAKPVITVTAVAKNAENRLQIYINNKELRQIDSDGNKIIYSAPVEIFKLGRNKISFRALGIPNVSKSEQTIMSGTTLLTGKNQPPWRRLFKAHNSSDSEKIIDGSYRIADTGSAAGEMANILYPIASIDKELCVRFQAKVEHATDGLSVVFRVADGKNIEIVTLQPDRIGLYYSDKSMPYETTNAFHDYEAIMKDGNLVLKVDGKELFNTPLSMSADNPDGYLKNNIYTIPNMNTQSLLFGSLSGTGTGSACWKNIRILKSSDEIQVRDLKIDVKFMRK